MNENACPAAYDHGDLTIGECAVCGWEADHRPKPHPDDMPTETGPDRIRKAIAIDRGGHAAPPAFVCFDGDC